MIGLIGFGDGATVVTWTGERVRVGVIVLGAMVGTLVVGNVVRVGAAVLGVTGWLESNSTWTYHFTILCTAPLSTQLSASNLCKRTLYGHPIPTVSM